MNRLICYGLMMGLFLTDPALAETAVAPIDAAKEGIFTPAYLLQSFVGLIIVIGLILILAMLFRRFGDTAMGAPGNMKVLGGLSVGQRERLVLVQVGDKQILVGVAPGSVQHVMAFDEPLANTQGQDNPVSAPWQALFKQSRSKDES
jgi:flagellar protein FliO/FliZ